ARPWAADSRQISRVSQCVRHARSHSWSRENTMQERKGGCLCGAVRYVLKREPQGAGICHCTHCQKQSGSAFSINLFVKEADYDQNGETRFYVDVGDSGLPLDRHFCGNCGSPIVTRPHNLPGIVVVKVGTLDTVKAIQPKTEIYTDHAAEWLAAVAGA